MLVPTARAAPHINSSDIEIDAEKRCLRRERLWGMTTDPVRDRQLRERLRRILDETIGSVAFVWPLPGEVDLRLLMRALAERGRMVGLPVVAEPGQPLLFRAWRDGVAMRRGVFGTTEPEADQPMIDPDIILVPMLCFDRARNRLGRGGGFYDRTLANRDSRRAIGFALADAEFGRVPVSAHDRAPDLIVTEREVV